MIRAYEYSDCFGVFNYRIVINGKELIQPSLHIDYDMAVEWSYEDSIMNLEDIKKTAECLDKATVNPKKVKNYKEAREMNLIDKKLGLPDNDWKVEDEYYVVATFNETFPVRADGATDGHFNTTHLDCRGINLKDGL